MHPIKKLMSTINRHQLFSFSLWPQAEYSSSYSLLDFQQKRQYCKFLVVNLKILDYYFTIRKTISKYLKEMD